MTELRQTREIAEKLVNDNLAGSNGIDALIPVFTEALDTERKLIEEQASDLALTHKALDAANTLLEQHEDTIKQLEEEVGLQKDLNWKAHEAHNETGKKLEEAIEVLTSLEGSLMDRLLNVATDSPVPSRNRSDGVLYGQVKDALRKLIQEKK